MILYTLKISEDQIQRMESLGLVTRQEDSSYYTLTVEGQKQLEALMFRKVNGG